MTQTDSYSEERRRLLREIDAEVTYTRRYTGRDRLTPRVREAMAAVPRHEFVPEELREMAYENHPLSIGEGQTISQPYIVAIMTELLDLTPESRVLEVGTGSGYQAAVLARLAREVYSVEIVPSLAASAAERLRQLGYGNVHTRQGDAYTGWPEQAPFDAVIVTAAAPELPPPLVGQLAPGGRMVIPLGRGLGQELLLIEKDAAGGTRETDLLPVAFVPLTRRRGP